ncbi:MAG: hypothetical protein ABI813_00010 [Bacteroidota bacterium]
MITKINSSGATTWTKTIGFNSLYGEAGYDVIQTSDGGYAALGIFDRHAGTGDFLLSHLDASGNIAWSKRFGTTRRQNTSGAPGDIDTLNYDGTPDYSLIEQSDS